MAPRGTQFIRGEYYHLYNRGCAGFRISFEERQYGFLFDHIELCAKAFGVSIIASCVMPNHYHLLIRQDADKSISDFVQRVFNSYSKAVNRAIGRTGTLFEGPFKSRHVSSEEYLRCLCRYIHRNPLEGGLVARLEEWPYSNYAECVGRRRLRAFDRQFIRERFGGFEEYRRFVSGRLGLPSAVRAELEELTRRLG